MDMSLCQFYIPESRSCLGTFRIKSLGELSLAPVVPGIANAIGARGCNLTAATENVVRTLRDTDGPR